MQLEELRNLLREFAKERDWDQFHSPKNLVMALNGEVGELNEHFQWLTEKDSYNPKDKEGVEEELADCLLYLIRLADKLDVDLHKASLAKIKKNAEKYPADQSRGKSDKYDSYHNNTGK